MKKYLVKFWSHDSGKEETDLFPASDIPDDAPSVAEYIHYAYAIYGDNVKTIHDGDALLFADPLYDGGP